LALLEEDHIDCKHEYEKTIFNHMQADSVLLKSFRWLFKTKLTFAHMNRPCPLHHNRPGLLVSYSPR